MKKLLLLLTVCTVALCASASNRYISPTGSDGDGKSWANAVHTIAQAIWNVGVGDTMFIAEGVYTEQISAQNGATYLGGYNAETGERNPELYETIIDGTGVTSFLVVKYGLPTATVTLDGLIFQNSAINEWGAAAMFLRGDMVIDHCIIRNCKGTERSGSDLNAGAIYIEDNDTEKHPIIRNNIIEYCEGTAGCAAIYNNSGIIENCIFRGCKGPLAVVRNMTTTSIVRNCLFYNNTITGAGSLGAIDNEGIVINNTIIHFL